MILKYPESMPHSSNIPVGGGDGGAVKAEPADEGGVIPFLDCGQTIRSVSPPGLSHTPKRNNDDGGGNNDDQSNGTAHAIAPAMPMRQPDIPRSSGDGDGNNTKKGNDILLSLKDEKYKRVYTVFCEKLWGKNRDESLTPKDVAQGMLDNLKVAVKRSGGKLSRGSTGGNTSHPLDTEALKSKLFCAILGYMLFKHQTR